MLGFFYVVTLERDRIWNLAGSRNPTSLHNFPKTFSPGFFILKDYSYIYSIT